MKKLFLSTTVLTVGLLTAGANAASAPKITIGGVANAQVAFVDEELYYSGVSIEEQDVIFRNDNEIHFSIDGNTDGGLEYGAVIQLEADVGDEQYGSPNADRTYVYLQCAKWGRFELGSNNSASDTMKLDADTFARGTGGIDGDFIYYTTNFTTASPGHVTSRRGTYQVGEEANKLTYYTPKFAGLQFGISYTPEYQNIGQTINGGSFYEDIISLGLKYEGEYEDFKFSVAGVADIGDADLYNFKDINEWNLGANVSYAGFTVGASYADFGDSRTVEGYNYKHYTAGISYANEQFGVGIGYFSFKSRDDNKIYDEYDTENIVISADYNLAPGIMPYAEFSKFNHNRSYNPLDNKGTVFLFGTELTF